MTAATTHEKVAETLANWVRRKTAGSKFPRVNLRFVLNERNVSGPVRRMLEEARDPGRSYCVRTSADEDAVLYRNGRPDGDDPTTTFVFVLFWTPGLGGHEHNGQSLQDLRAVDVRDVLGADLAFELPQEAAVVAQIDEAGASWPEAHQGRAREHLRRAWQSLTHCLRARNGGRERSVPFVRSIESYVEFLEAALVPGDVWQNVDASQRPAFLVRRWGEALVHLQMFCLPEIASVLGISTNPATPVPVPSKTRESLWIDWIEQTLAENLEYALDPTGLGESLAGKSALEDQLERLKAVPLCRDEKTHAAARQALLRFCQDGDDDALRVVEWLFYKDPGSRRTQSLGLQGLLLARNQRTPRLSPLDRARAETLEMFGRALGRETTEYDSVRSLVEEKSAQGAPGLQALHEAMNTLGQGELPDGPPEFRRACEKATQTTGWKPKTARQVAARWERLWQPEANDRTEEAPTLLLGLTRLVWGWRRDREEVDADEAGGTSARASAKLIVRFEGRENQTPVSVSLDPSQPESVLRALSDFLTKKVQPLAFGDAGEAADPDDEDDEDASNQLRFFVEREAERGRETIGKVEVTWKEKAARLWKASRGNVLVQWERVLSPDQAVAGSRVQDQIVRAIDEGTRPSSPAVKVVDESWASYVRASGDAPGWPVIASIAPTSADARGWVEAWAEALREVEASTRSATLATELQALDEAMNAALDREDFVEAQRIRKEIKAKKDQTAEAPKPPPMESVRKLLAQNSVAFHGAEGEHLRVVLSPHHPLVVRLRALEDDLIAEVLQALWADVWPEGGRSELDDALDNWGLPEPMHAWCAWDGVPLVFEGWLDGLWASFAPLESGRDADAAVLGVRTVSRVIDQYCHLFPASADRLRIRARGDREGGWVSVVTESDGKPGLVDHARRGPKAKPPRRA